MDAILVLGSLDDADEATGFLVGLLEKHDVRVVKLTREEYDTANAAGEEAVRKELKLKEGADWPDEATPKLSDYLKKFLADAKGLEVEHLKAVIIIRSKSTNIDWWPFDELVKHPLVTGQP